jgi:uncharacterized protein
VELTNEFTVGIPIDRAWAVLTDIERIAPCMPGAELHGVEDDQYRGVVKVKVGPITAQYKGTAKFVEKDDDAHRAVLAADGRDVRGQGTASATVTANLSSDGEATRVVITTDLRLTRSSCSCSSCCGAVAARDADRPHAHRADPPALHEEAPCRRGS